MDVQPVVFVISDDSKTRRSLHVRLKQLGFHTHLCHSPEEFQQASSPRQPGCVLLDVADPESDLAWLATLGPCDSHWPVIGIAAAADLDTAVLAMKRGAFDFLLEKCGDRRLRDAVCSAFHWDAQRRKQIAKVQSIRRRLQRLSAAHHNVLALLLKGKSNREIADALDVSVRSIEVRRAKVMETLKARSVAALVKKVLMAEGTGSPNCWPGADRDNESPSGSPRSGGTQAR